MGRAFSLIRITTIMAICMGLLTSCGSTKTSQGASTGAIVGGLVDGWGGAATGALIGAGIGLMEDTADDQKRQQEQRDRELALVEKSAVTSDNQTAYSPENTNPLTGSTWRVISLVNEDSSSLDFASIILTFQTNTKATTLMLWQDGRSETYGESYAVVSDVLVFTGKDYVTNAKYVINNNQMVLATPSMRVVLEEVEEKI